MDAIELQVKPPDWREVSDEEFLALQEEASLALEATPAGVPAVRGWELIDGVLLPMSPIGFDQGDVTGEIVEVLRGYVRQHGMGRVLPDVVTHLDDEGRHRVAPDVAFLETGGKAERVGQHVQGAPKLVVEITVPDSVERDLITKKALYHRFGVEWYWIVNLVTGETEEFRWAEAEYELISRTPLTETFRPALFPDLEINLPTE